MTHEQNDRYGPTGDPKFHRSFQALMSGLEAARQAPRESGRLEVTPEPHTGCKKFKQRFGLAALEWTLRPEHRPLRLRGLYLRVLQGGRVHQGDAIELQSLPHSN